MATNNRPHFGVFTRITPDGPSQSRVADTPADAVQMAFDGWAQTGDATANQDQAETVAAAGDKSKPSVKPSTSAGDKPNAGAGDKPSTSDKPNTSTK